MKPPKELALPYPAALKQAEKSLAEAEDHADQIEIRVETMRSRRQELESTIEQLERDGVALTVDGTLDDQAALAHDQKIMAMDLELKRLTAALAELDTQKRRDEASVSIQEAKKQVRLEWELYWQAVAEKAADQVLEAVGAYIREGSAAHWRSAQGLPEDWLQFVLLPKLGELGDEMLESKYPVPNEVPKSKAEQAADKERQAHSEQLDRERATTEAKKVEAFGEQYNATQAAGRPQR